MSMHVTPGQWFDDALEALCGLPGVREVVDEMPEDIDSASAIGFLTNRNLPECRPISPIELVVSGGNATEIIKIAQELGGGL